MLHSNQQTQKRGVVQFRHFTRKGHALFSCMGREVRIAVLSAATLASATAALAQNTAMSERGTHHSVKKEILDEAEVTGTRAPLAAEQSARIVTTLTRQDIERAAVQSIPDLLKQLAGVDVRQRGAFGIQTDISIDGGTFDQITLLLNGIAINNPQTGHLSADFPVVVDDIERIEVLQGAASRVFGSQAFSGAINIVTRTGAAGAQARVQGGSFGTWGGGASATLHGQRSAYKLSADYGQSDGGTLNSDFRQTKLFHQGLSSLHDLTLNWQAGYAQKAYGANTFYSARYPNQWEENSRYFFTLKGETRGRVRLTPTFAWVRSYDHFQLIRDTQTGENFHRTDVFTLGLNATSRWQLGQSAIGVEMRSEDILSTNLGRPLDSAQFVTIEGEDGRHYTKRYSRTNVSLFAEHNVVLSRWTLSAGVMVNRNNAIDERFRFYPGADISYRAAEALTLFASWNMAMRLPTFTDLFYKSATHEGNVGLRPERTSALRTGARLTLKGVKASAQAFYNRGTDMIDWVMYHAADTYHSAAFQLDNYGVSLSLSCDMNTLAKLPATVQLGYTYLHQERQDDTPIYKSTYALEYLRHKFTGTLHHSIYKGLSATWSVRLQQREGNYLLYDAATKTTTLRPYDFCFLADAKLQWNTDSYDLYVSANNLFGRHYYDLGNVPQPGTWIMAGAKIKFRL